MPSLKELYEKAQATGKVEYDYFTGGGTSRPFNQTSIGFGDNDQPYIRLGYDPAVKFRSRDPTNTFNSALPASNISAIRNLKAEIAFLPCIIMSFKNSL